jgi:hypothetical protein
MPNPLNAAIEERYWKITLYKLSGDEHSPVRQAIAGHPNTPETALRLLALDEGDGLVRAELMLNRATPDDLRLELAEDEALIEHLNAYITANADLSDKLLFGVLEPGDYETLEIIAERPSARYELLEQLLQTTDDEDILAKVALHPNFGMRGFRWMYDAEMWGFLAGCEECPEGILARIARQIERREGSTDMWFTGEMETMIENPNVPHDVLEAALDFEDEQRTHAEAILRNPGASNELRERARAILGPDAPTDSDT